MYFLYIDIHWTTIRILIDDIVYISVCSNVTIFLENKNSEVEINL